MSESEDVEQVLELFSGIGGMHYALKKMGSGFRVATAIDISDVANRVYRHNFPDTRHLQSNICGLESSTLNKLGISVILMSPPCQPFTRQGLKKGLEDPRSQPLTHILKILPQLTKLKYLLVENVKGFESSSARDLLVGTLSDCGFKFQEFLISPTHLGIPNSRLRYYLIARKGSEFGFQTKPDIWTSLDDLGKEHFPQRRKDGPESCLESYLEPESSFSREEYELEDKLLLKHHEVLDVIQPGDSRSCCFTKSYGRYAEGTGSVLIGPEQAPMLDGVYDQVRSLPKEDAEAKLQLLRSLRIRFFTPREVARLMGFPEAEDGFSFPAESTKIQCYRVLGNSLNVTVVAFLLQLLFEEK